MSDLGISGAPENGQGAPEGNPFNYEQAYGQLRPEYTRTTQDLSEAQQRLSEYEAFMEALSDPETAHEALASLGFEMETGAAPEPDELVDPLETEVKYLRTVVEELKQGSELEAASREEQKTLNLRDDFIAESIDYIESATQMKFKAEDEEILGNLAISMSDENGVPDVKGAYEALYGDNGFAERQRSGWIDSKQSAYSAPLGTSIPADKRPTNRAERIEYADRRLQALEAQQN